MDDLDDVRKNIELNDFDWFQQEAKKTAIYPKSMGLTYTALGLASEAGEYAGKIKKYIRDGKVLDDQACALELGDCLWYLAMASDHLGYDLSEIADLVVKKLRDRAVRNVISGDGDYR